GIVLTHFVVSGDVARSRRFYTDVLGGEAAGELARLLLPVARACAVALPYPNPVGVPAPPA
ncbi:MAG: hypothetical protein WAK71_01150, partial [Streptosporangiaceae bacterium]